MKITVTGAGSSDSGTYDGPGRSNEVVVERRKHITADIELEPGDYWDTGAMLGSRFRLEKLGDRPT